MKKSFFVLLTVIMAVIYTPKSYAQLFSMGVKGGMLINAEKLKFTHGLNDFSDKSTRAGFEAGLQFTVNIPSLPIFIQPELIYSRTSSRYSTGQENAGELKLRSNMFSIPVLVGMKFSAFRVMAGTVFMFPSMDMVSMDNLNEKFAPRYKNFMMGLKAGAGVTLGRVTIDAHYQWQLSSLAHADFDATGKISNADIKSGIFALSLGYTIFRIL